MHPKTALIVHKSFCQKFHLKTIQNKIFCWLKHNCFENANCTGSIIFHWQWALTLTCRHEWQLVKRCALSQTKLHSSWHIVWHTEWWGMMRCQTWKNWTAKHCERIDVICHGPWCKAAVCSAKVPLHCNCQTQINFDNWVWRPNCQKHLPWGKTPMTESYGQSPLLVPHSAVAHRESVTTKATSANAIGPNNDHFPNCVTSVWNGWMEWIHSGGKFRQDHGHQLSQALSNSSMNGQLALKHGKWQEMIVLNFVGQHSCLLLPTSACKAQVIFLPFCLALHQFHLLCPGQN